MKQISNQNLVRNSKTNPSTILAEEIIQDEDKITACWDF